MLNFSTGLRRKMPTAFIYFTLKRASVFPKRLKACRFKLTYKFLCLVCSELWRTWVAIDRPLNSLTHHPNPYVPDYRALCILLLSVLSLLNFGHPGNPHPSFKRHLRSEYLHQKALQAKRAASSPEGCLANGFLSICLLDFKSWSWESRKEELKPHVTPEQRWGDGWTVERLQKIRFQFPASTQGSSQPRVVPSSRVAQMACEDTCTHS